MFIQGITKLSTRTPACHPGVMMLSADFDLPVDVSELFPYINAALDDAKMYDNPMHIKFTFSGRMYVLYASKGMGTPFETLADAEGGVNRMIEYLNGLYRNRETITPNNKIYKPIAVIDVFKILPGTNCKSCGFATCLAFAAALSKGEVPYAQCPDLTSTELKGKLAEIGVPYSQ